LVRFLGEWLTRGLKEVVVFVSMVLGDDSVGESALVANTGRSASGDEFSAHRRFFAFPNPNSVAIVVNDDEDLVWLHVRVGGAVRDLNRFAGIFDAEYDWLSRHSGHQPVEQGNVLYCRY
jgi:hypothetical protein